MMPDFDPEWIAAQLGLDVQTLVLVPFGTVLALSLMGLLLRPSPRQLYRRGQTVSALAAGQRFALGFFGGLAVAAVATIGLDHLGMTSLSGFGFMTAK